MTRILKQHTGTGIMVLLAAAVFIVVGIVPSAVGAPPWSDERGQRGGMFRQRHHQQVLGIWQNQQLIDQLGLTKEQLQKLRNADYAAREKHLALKAELDQLRLQMDKALSNGASDKKTVRQFAEKAADVQGQLYVQKVEARLGLETILTAEQIEKLALDTRFQKRGGPGGGWQRNARRDGAGMYRDGDCPRGR